MTRSAPKMIARPATIRQSLAAAERRLLELDCPKEREQQREIITQLRHALKAAR